jgi:nucleoid-associated protein YgaU
VPDHDGADHRVALLRAGVARLRLTRRGRLVCSVMAAVLVAAVLAATGWALTVGHAAAQRVPAGGQGADLSGAGSVVVVPGDSLWSIAERFAPRADPRATVQQIVVANALSGAVLQPGQVLRLPS